MKNYKSSLITDAICPFFVTDSNFRSVQSQITCEGLLEKLVKEMVGEG